VNEDPQTQSASDGQRRALLHAAAGLAVGSVALSAAGTADATTGAVAPAPEPSGNAKPTGSIGDFDFLAGEWRIEHRRLKAPGQWDEFKGEATCWTVLGGIASIEELRIPARNFSGMGVRILDVEKRVWADFWVNAKSGVLTPPGLAGGFVDGVGTFEAEDHDNGKPIKVRGIWDRIASKSCRWRQGVSRDSGKTWEYTWFMDWTRA
jgi:hypothetical protein